MKKNNIWYLGYVIGLCSLILSWTFNLNGAIKVLLTFVLPSAYLFHMCNSLTLDYWQRTVITKLV
ncbi:hypothetical protein [Granulicatella sp. HMSC30F09]|uniref:hypothetical protein n=1 Tax=Granulicatella sp. HMSC30F09 TaxID=1581071 RepID=UPI001FF02764|nr:hypothetical protein [Granulicatella sp. HMSC30F09]